MQYQAFGNLPYIVIYLTLLDGEFPSSMPKSMESG